MDDFTERIRKARRDFRSARDELAALPDKLRGELAQIRADRDLTSEEKEIKTRKAEEQARARQRTLMTAAEAARQEATDLARQVRVDRKISPQAQQRVRELLDRGTGWQAIRERARELGDDETTAALLTEALWFGDRKGFKDEKGRDYSREVVAACTRDLAEIGVGAEAVRNKTLVELDELHRPFKEISERAAKAVIGRDTPLDRLKVAYATGAGRKNGGDDE